MSIEVSVDVSNPGQFFAACGLFELVARLDSRTVCARFDSGRFVLETSLVVGDVLSRFTTAGFAVDKNDESDAGGSDEEDDEDEGGSDAASPLKVGAPFDLVLDWWKSEEGRDLKVWAGTMNGPRIAQAMLAALRDPATHTSRMFDHACVVFDPTNPKKKVEPFYFDARRAGNASSLDVGFAPNDLKFETLAFPAVEALCLVGLQRFRPKRVERRLFEYGVWTESLPMLIASPVVGCAVEPGRVERYRFESWFRTSQKKHKAFKPATLLRKGEGR